MLYYLFNIVFFGSVLSITPSRKSNQHTIKNEKFAPYKRESSDPQVEEIEMLFNVTNIVDDTWAKTTVNNAYFTNFKLNEGHFLVETLPGLKDLALQFHQEANEFFDRIMPIYYNEGFWNGFREHKKYMANFGMDPMEFPIFWSETGNKIQDVITDRILELMGGKCTAKELTAPFAIIMRYCPDGMEWCDQRGFNPNLHSDIPDIGLNGMIHISAWLPIEPIRTFPVLLIHKPKVSQQFHFENNVLSPQILKELTQKDTVYYFPNISPGEIIFYDAGNTPHMALPTKWGERNVRSFALHFYCNTEGGKGKFDEIPHT